MPITITGQGTLNNETGSVKLGSENVNVVKYGTTTVWTTKTTVSYTFTTKDQETLGVGTTTTNEVTVDTNFRSASKLVISWSAKQTATAGSDYVNNDSGNYEIQIGMDGTYTTIQSSPFSQWTTGYSKGTTASGTVTLTGNYYFTKLTLRFKKNIAQNLHYNIGGSVVITRNL